MTPAEERERWRTRAACQGKPPVLWFPERQEGKSRLFAEDYAAGKAICDVCPVSGDCLEWANNTNQTGGMWGGLTPEERNGWRQMFGHRRECRWCEQMFHVAPGGRAVEYCCDDHRDRAARQQGHSPEVPVAVGWAIPVEPWREAAADAAFETGAALSMSPYS